MAEFNVFYSWQSDLPRKTTRDFIHDAATEAIRRMALGMSLDDSPRLDEDTKGVSGIPAIGDTILGKIDRCAVFLADVSLVGETRRDDKQKKRMPNPNVLFELGYAFARIGWRRLILVMNTGYGDESELPFDLRFRRFPFGYKIAEDRSDIDKQQAALSSQIEMALKAMVQEEHQVVTDTLKKLDGQARHFLRTNSKHQYFWETEVGKNTIPGQNDLAIHRLLQLGIIECIPFTNDSGFAYTWTYIGRLCTNRLGLPESPTESFRLDEPHAPCVITDTSYYDQISIERKNTAIVPSEHHNSADPVQDG